MSDLIAQGSRPGENGLYLDPTTFEPYTGVVVELHESGQSVKVRGTLKDGRWTGERRTYDEREGGVTEIVALENGVLHGDFWRGTWYGNTWNQGSYKNGVLHGRFYYSGHGEGYGGDRANNRRGTYNMGSKCGEWFEADETVTYDPCPSN
jgi:hypothetical protein